MHRSHHTYLWKVHVSRGLIKKYVVGVFGGWGGGRRRHYRCRRISQDWGWRLNNHVSITILEECHIDDIDYVY